MSTLVSNANSLIQSRLATSLIIVVRCSVGKELAMKYERVSTTCSMSASIAVLVTALAMGESGGDVPEPSNTTRGPDASPMAPTIECMNLDLCHLFKPRSPVNLNFAKYDVIFAKFAKYDVIFAKWLATGLLFVVSVMYLAER